MVKVDIETGRIEWRTKMLPDNGGKGHLYSGAALWGSSPAVDVKRNLVFIATGNLYSVPPDVQACQIREANKTVPDVPDPCIRAGDYSESILALDLDTGKIVWAHHLGGVDVWNIACAFGPSQPNCPPAAGPDYDFGEAPMLLTVRSNKSRGSRTSDDEESWRDIVVAGQKSGFVWALDRDDGQIVWDAVRALLIIPSSTHHMQFLLSSGTLLAKIGFVFLPHKLFHVIHGMMCDSQSIPSTGVVISCPN